VLNEAVRVTTEALRVESAAVLQTLPDRDETALPVLGEGTHLSVRFSSM